MTDFRSLLSAAVRAVAIDGADSFYWFGNRSSAPKALLASITRRERFDYFRMRLQQRLYWNFYASGQPTPLVEDDGADESDEESFAELLSAANTGSGTRETGWRLVSRNDQTAIVARNGLTLSVTLDRISRGRNGQISLRHLNELRGVSPGFYTALGDRPLIPGEPLLRVYWNIPCAGAVPFIAAVTSILNKKSIPFRAKVVSNPLAFDRRDAAVLYVMRRGWRWIHPHLRRIYRSLEHLLEAGTPAMTKEIGRGVGLAEDPGRDMSFGQHRCQIIADALIESHKKRATDVAPRLAFVLAAFERSNIDPTLPYLNAASSDVYESL